MGVERKKKSTIDIVIYIIFIIFSIIQVFPLLWSVLFSFKDNQDIVINSALSLPTQWRFTNYYDAWTRGHVKDYFLNSMIVSAITLICVILFSSMAAYAVSRMKWKLSHAFFYMILIGMMIPLQAILIPEFFIMKSLHLTKSYLAVIVPYIGAGVPLGMFVISGFLSSVPREVEEAAFIDDANIFRCFFSIIFRIITPALTTVGVLTFLNSWNEFIMAVTFIYNTKLFTLPIGLMAFQGTHGVEWGPMGASMVIASIPALVFYFKFSDMIEKSFTAGAILK